MIDKWHSARAGIPLEHWRALVAVVDAGGYARAAEALGKSQSTISHSIRRLEDLLEIRVLRIVGRRAVLTEVGRVVQRRARFLIEEAADIERVARTLGGGVEPEVCVAVAAVFPSQILVAALAAFVERFPDTGIELVETGISGVADVLADGQAQLAVTPLVPDGLVGSRLTDLQLVCVAHPDHPLHALDRAVTERDLGRHRELVMRGPEKRRSGQTGSLQRITVGTMGTRVQALCHGLGYGWCPALEIQRELDEGLLAPLQLARGGSRVVNFYLVFADEEGAGPATHALARQIEAEVVTSGVW